MDHDCAVMDVHSSRADAGDNLDWIDRCLAITLHLVKTSLPVCPSLARTAAYPSKALQWRGKQAALCWACYRH